MSLNIKLGNGTTAVARDISPSSMYVEIDDEHDGNYELGSKLLFEMELSEARLKFTAEGEVVRIEHRGGIMGLAVKLQSPRLVPLDAALL